MNRIVFAVVLLPSLLFGIDGVVVNRTTGKPQPNAIVTLQKISQGMETVASVKADAEGKFVFKGEADTQIPHLIQASHQGVDYNRMVPPGTKSTGIEVDVFDVTTKPDAAKIADHVTFVQPDGSAVQVNEIIQYTNSGNQTFYDPKTIGRFYLPPAANGEVQVSVSAGNMMPLQREPDKTGLAGVYTVNFPVKPGQTRFDIVYKLPASDSFETRVLDGSAAKIVVPPGVKLTSEALAEIGTEPTTQAVIYNVKAPKIIAKVEGTGTLRSAAPAADASSDEADTGGGIEAKRPLIYDRLYWVLGLGFLMLALGFVILYRKQVPAVSAERR